MSKRPPNCFVYNEYTITRALQSFHPSKHFILGLLDGDTCLPPQDLRPTTRDVDRTLGADGPSASSLGQ
jgi:hypothetical protein